MSKSINSNRAEEAKRRVDLIREVVNLTTKLNPEITTDGRAMLSDRASKMSADALDAMVLELQERLQKKRKTEKERNLYCYRCGTSWTPGYVACTSCGSVDKGEGTARPTVHISGDTETFMGPWRLLP